MVCEKRHVHALAAKKIKTLGNNSIISISSSFQIDVHRLMVCAKGHANNETKRQKSHLLTLEPCISLPHRSDCLWHHAFTVPCIMQLVPMQCLFH